MCARPWLILSMQCCHIILLSKVTPSHVTLFTSGTSRPIRCSASSGALKSSGEIDYLSFPFINLYVPSLTPWLHWSEAALQFAENTTFVFLTCKYKYHPRTGRVPGAAGASFEYRMYITGARTEPWGTPTVIFLGVENSPSTKTLKLLLVIKEANSFFSLFEKGNS
jgi:hypothetical protein